MTELAATHPHGHRVTLITLSDNLGAVARNVGVAASSTTYVAFCDDDSGWQADATTIAEREFDRNPRLAVLAGRTVIGPHGQPDPFSIRLGNSPLGRPPGLPGPAILGFQAGAAMVQEQLVALDLAASGWQLCYCPSMVALHHPSPLRPTAIAQQSRVLRNDFLTSCMRRPPSKCLASAAALLRSATHDRAHLRAAVEAAARLPAALRNRRMLPPELEDQVRLRESVSTTVKADA